MQYKFLGNAGLRVSELCLSANYLWRRLGLEANKDGSRGIFDAFVEAGGNFIDTANIYTNRTGEKMQGEFVGKECDRFVIATKLSLHLIESLINP